MEQWEVLVSSYPSSPERRSFGKALQTATVVLKEDLATFEKEWILQTLLLEPVELLNTILSKSSDDTWLKSIGDAFKLLSDIVEQHSEQLDQYYEDIVKICHRPYEPQTRKQAFDCLTQVIKRSPLGASEAARHVDALEGVPTCRAPVALLVGAICENHPEMISDEANRIWRIYLNLLESSKNTEKMVSSLLQGILGLFKHFGRDLPTYELINFYDKLSKEYLKMNACDKVCCTILEDHSNLFKVSLAADFTIREYLWVTLSDWKVAAALRSVYAALACFVEKERLQDIVNSEIVPRTRSSRTITKFTSLRILSYAQTNNKVCLGVTSNVDVQTLEFELRNKNVSYDIVEAVSFSIQANLPNSDKLLQTAMMFYDNLPKSKKKYVVVYGILNAPSELRTAAITFLISESCQPDSMDKYLPLWIDLFNTDNGKDLTVVEKGHFVFEDFMSHLVLVLGTFLDEIVEEQNIPKKLSSLLTLSSHILTLQSSEEYTRNYCILTLPLLISCIHECGMTSAIMAAARGVVSHMCDDDDFGDLFKLIEIDRCHDEALLCESCLTLIQAPGGLGDPSDIVKALQIIFSRNDVEPKTLLLALRKLETLIMRDTEPLNLVLDELLILIENLKSRCDSIGKDGRVLRKDITMFLGKHSRRHEINNNSIRQTENDLIVKLNETLVLNVPNPNEGTSQKINLQRILHLAISEEEPDALQTLLVIICANLSTRKEPTLQLALTHVVGALCASLVRPAHAHAHAHAQALARAVPACGTVRCVRELLHFITNSKSPGVRRMLSDALEDLLKNTMSDITEQLVNTVDEHAVLMMMSDLSLTKRAGLDITDTLLVSIKDNNILIISFLPKILILISRTFEITSENTFDKASKLFIEKIHLFDENTVNDTLDSLINMKTNMNRDTMNMKIFKKTVKMNLIFIKNVLDHKRKDYATFLRDYFQTFSEGNDIFSAFILANIRMVFDLKDDFCEELLCYNDCSILNDFFEIKPKNTFDLEAILRFLQEYSGILSVIKYEKTLHHLADIISKLRPSSVKYIHKTLSACLSTYKNNLKRLPQILITSLERYCDFIPLEQISMNIEKDNFLADHALKVHSLKRMLNIFDIDLSILSAKISCQKWAIEILRLYARDDNLRSKMSYLTDLLSVSLKFLRVEDIRQLILEGSEVKSMSNEMIGVRFCREFMVVFYEYILDGGFWYDETAPCCVLLNDIVKYHIRRKNQMPESERILELVEKLWPKYEIKTTFEQKYSLLLDLSCLPKQLSADSNPLQWAVRTLTTQETSREDRSRLIGVLPGGEEFSSAYRNFASSLPTRFSELKGDTNASLRAIFDALATNKDHTLLDIIVTLAGGDETKGWWDDAIDSCMATLALKSDLDIHNYVYTRCWDGLTLGVCNRVMTPLLRYSTSTICERFFSIHLEDLLAKLRRVQRDASAHYAYHKCVLDYTRALNMLQVAFEKIAPSSLESPGSRLYSAVAVEQSWHLVREACKLCVELRARLAPATGDPGGGDPSLRTACRVFHCAAFNCLSAAICRRRPNAKFYLNLFDVRVFNTLVDADMVYDLPLRQRWAIRSRRHATSVSSPRAHDAGTSRTTRTRTHTVRTRLFLRTLSDNPLRYDLFDHDDDDAGDMMETQELQLTDSELNNHESMATLTCLLCHVATVEHAQWTDAVVTLLEGRGGGGGDNAARVLAQAICNCKEDLQPHASALRPALLAFIANTPTEKAGVKMLDGLHIDVLFTLTLWRDDALELTRAAQAHLNSTVEYFINTCIENRQRESLCNSLVEDLGKVLEVYGRFVHVGWNVFVPYIEGQTKQCVHILKHMIKSSIYIPELLPTLLSKYEGKHLPPTHTTAELFGKALAVCKDPTVRRESLAKYHMVLEKVRVRNVGEYVRMLYYAQGGYRWCCDERNFRTITDLVQKLDAERSKCLQIISTYLANVSSCTEIVTDMFDTIDLCELITTGETEAIVVVMNGLTLMSEVLRRRCVMVVADYCAHALVKVRRAALQVMMKAFGELFTIESQPPSKRQRTESTTPLLKTLDSKDVYTSTILSCLGRGVSDKDEQTASIVRNGVADRLSTDSFIRFTECFYMTIYLPLTHTSNNNTLSVSLYALLEMYFSDLRAQDKFKKIKLRDEPLRMIEAGPSTLLTKLRTYHGTYHGTFRSTLTNRQRSGANITQDTNNTDLDVQVPIDSILGTFLQFSKTNPQVSQALIIELMKNLTTDDSFDFKATMSRQLAELVRKGPSELTPVIVQACKVIIDDLTKIDGFQTSVEKLKDSTLGTEGEQITKVLLEEVQLRCRGYEQFVLGSANDENFDDIMDSSNAFCLEELVGTFGKLSNWDELTLQQKSRIERTCIPALWTDNDTFRRQLDTFTGTGWFHKVSLAYKGERKQDSMMWLREVDRWPRRHFAVSAVTEAIQWQYTSDEKDATSCNIRPSDCLAEWAARLMLRSSRLTQSEEESSPEDIMLFHSHELQWCVSASERGLSSLVLDCVKRNTVNLYEDETLSWLQQKVLALRAIGLKQNDSNILKKALDTAEKFTPQFREQSSPEDVIGMNALILQMSYDLKSLSKDKLKTIIQETNMQQARQETMSQRNKQALNSVYEYAMIYYDDLWTESADFKSKEVILNNMADILGDVVEHDIPCEVFATVILNKFDDLGQEINEIIAGNVLNQLQRIYHTLDSFCLDEIKNHAHLFPAHVLTEYSVMIKYEDERNTEKYKRCLQLVGDASYTCANYCELLMRACDQTEWKKIFDKMKEKIFENPFAGLDYQLLNKYKEDLYEIYDYDKIDSIKRKQVLKSIYKQLLVKPSATLRLSALCPTLASNVERDGCLARLLGVPPSLSIVKCDEQITVFTDSIRRPCVMRAVLSNGTSRRYLLKGGERLRLDAAAQRAARAAQGGRGGRGHFVGYNVTPLSEDCGLIEYLENNERLRSLISRKYDLDAQAERPPDEELILSPGQASLQLHYQLSDRVPAYALRSEIERQSSCIEDFIAKKRRFLDSISTVAILTWIFGLGDRHLQNLLYDTRDGAVCCVDWGAIFQYGARELPPARLTRNILAVCDVQVLESNLQSLLTTLRSSHKLYIHVIRMCFKWMGEEFKEKELHIENLLQGKALSFEITKAAIEKSTLKHKEKYLKLLDEVFIEFEKKENYSIQEQISCLLKQCTEPRILGVTKSGWEPWL